MVALPRAWNEGAEERNTYTYKKMAKTTTTKSGKGGTQKLTREQIRRRCWIAGLSVAALGLLAWLLHEPKQSDVEKQLLDSCEANMTALSDALSAFQDAEAMQAERVKKELAEREDVVQRIAQLAHRAKELTRDFDVVEECATLEEADKVNESKLNRQKEVASLKTRAQEERNNLAARSAAPAETAAPQDPGSTETPAPAENTGEEPAGEEPAGEEPVVDENQLFAPPMSWMLADAEVDIFADVLEPAGDEGGNSAGAGETDSEEPAQGEDANEGDGSTTDDIFGGGETGGDDSGETGTAPQEEPAGRTEEPAQTGMFGDVDVKKVASELNALLEKGDLKAAREKLQKFRVDVDTSINNCRSMMKSTPAQTRYNQITNAFTQLSGELDLVLQKTASLPDVAARTTELLKEADEHIASFPNAEFKDAIVVEKPEPVDLVPGEADFSIVTTEEMADGLVRNLVEQWVKYHAGAANAVETDARPNGWRYVLQRNGETQTVDVIAGGSPTGAHAYISPQQNLQMAAQSGSDKRRTICLDALVFMNADAERPVMKLDDIRKCKKYLMPEGSMDRVAADLFNFVPKAGDVQLNETAPSLPSDGLLVVSYHNRAQYGGKPVSIEYNSPRSCLPDAMNIASRHYLYTFDIVLETLKADTKQLKESFEQYFMEKKDASDLVAVHGYVPLYAGANLTPTLLTDKQHLPVKEILAKLDPQTRSEFGYLSGRSTVKGVLLPYPVRFPTDSDTEKRCVLRDDDLALLKRMVSENLKELKAKYGKLLVVVTGHTDYRGDRNKKNLPLSRGRAARFLDSSLSADIAPEFISRPQNVRNNADIAPYKCDGGDVMVMTHGCSEDYYIISQSEAEMYGKDKATLEKTCQPDRRANIYVILPND